MIHNAKQEMCSMVAAGASLSRTVAVHLRPRHLLVISLLLLPGLARAAVTCTGWGGQTNQNISLNLPATVDLPLASVPGTVLATGSASLPGALRCTDSGTGLDVTTTNWSFSSPYGYDSGTDSTLLTRGIGLKLAWVSAVGSAGAALPTSGGVGNTDGFNWSQLNWTLVRTSGAEGPGQSTFGTVGQGVLTLPDATTYIMRLQQNPAVTVTAACTLSSDKTTVLLPDTDAGALAKDGYSASAQLTGYVTCPANVRVFSTLTMSTPAADATDNTLVASTGSAKGVAIEVLDGSGKRISAQGGTVILPRFTQGSSAATPGASQVLSVRMAHQAGAAVVAGTVQGTFTLTLTVN